MGINSSSYQSRSRKEAQLGDTAAAAQSGAASASTSIPDPTYSDKFAPGTKTRVDQYGNVLIDWGNEDANNKVSASARSRSIADEILNAKGNDSEYQNYRDAAVAGIDSSWHDAGQNVAESYARRGLGGSGIDLGGQTDLATKRLSAVGDATLKARAAAVANQQSDLAREQSALIGVQTSDINSQMLALQQQAQYDKALQDAVQALAQVGGEYYGYTKDKQNKVNNRNYGSSGTTGSDGYYAQLPGKING